jgi:hypothetical protein
VMGRLTPLMVICMEVASVDQVSVDCSLVAQSRKDGQTRCAYGRSLDGILAPVSWS